MKDLIRNTISKIKSEQIKPQARWKFLLRKYSVWLAFAAGLILGAISLAVALDWTTQLDWDIYRLSKPGLFFSIFPLMPYVWIILILMFGTFTFFDLRRTENGYKFSFKKIVAILLGGLLLITAIFFVFGIGKRFHVAVSETVPFYGDHMMVTRQNQWTNPENGFLAGKIISVDQNNLEIRDFRGNDWIITLDDKTKVMPMAVISNGEMIKVIGRESGKKEFQAFEIRPWMGKGMNRGSFDRFRENGPMMRR